jgi:hypothetical protein
VSTTLRHSCKSGPYGHRGRLAERPALNPNPRCGPFYDDRTIVSATVALGATVQIGTMHWLNPRAEAARFGQRAKA